MARCRPSIFRNHQSFTQRDNSQNYDSDPDPNHKLQLVRIMQFFTQFFFKMTSFTLKWPYMAWWERIEYHHFLKSKFVVSVKNSAFFQVNEILIGNSDTTKNFIFMKFSWLPPSPRDSREFSISHNVFLKSPLSPWNDLKWPLLIITQNNLRSRKITLKWPRLQNQLKKQQKSIFSEKKIQNRPETGIIVQFLAQSLFRLFSFWEKYPAKLKCITELT